MMTQQCQAEDQGGWPICKNDATLQTKQEIHGRRWFYCEAHRINKHVWKPDELEPITTSGAERLARDEAAAGGTVSVGGLVTRLDDDDPLPQCKVCGMDDGRHLPNCPKAPTRGGGLTTGAP